LITKQLIEHIEGEASVYFDMEGDKVDFATVVFPHFRGMESFLEQKSALDALVITPRVCGICGHAHLMATVRALEDAYKNGGYEVIPTQKANIIREFTLVMEMIQNHYKWFTMVIIPELIKLGGNSLENKPLKGAYASSLASKAIAVFGGQWPHSSYMVVGGVTCDPTYVEVLQAKSYVQELIKFFEKESLGLSLEAFLSFESCKEFQGIDSDIAQLEKTLIALGMHTKGFAHDRFLVLGEHTFSGIGKLKGTRVFHVDAKFVTTTSAYTPHEKTYAYNALYKDVYYETGSLARLMSTHSPMVKNMHRRYKDSAYSRVMARIFELATLLQHAKSLLQKIDVTQDSVVPIEHIHTITAKGIGVVEAPRGPLVHEIFLKNGVIESYKIVTPTQFNIGSSTRKKPTPVQKAMQGLSKTEAEFVFRTFDVCSVCTTH